MYEMGHPTKLFWCKYLSIMQRPVKKDCFLENKYHIVPTFNCDGLCSFLEFRQSLHGSSQLFGQDGKFWTNGWRKENVLVNFICICGRYSPKYFIQRQLDRKTTDNLLLYFEPYFFHKIRTTDRGLEVSFSCLVERYIKNIYRSSRTQLKLHTISATTKDYPIF